jgi:PKD repeat protein
MRKLLLLSLALIFLFLQNLSGQIIISQYYEGSGNNKWLEVTNTGTTAIAAGTYFLCNFNNTAADNPATSSQNGCVAIPALNAGETILFRNSGAVTPGVANRGCASSTSSGVISFNGNDLVIITTSNSTTAGASWSSRVDVVGNGTENWGANTSFFRNANILTGNTTFTLSEYSQVTNAVVDAATGGSEQLCTHVFNAPCVLPTASFGFTPTGLTVAFGDSSDGTPTSWLWDFGDGNTSTQQNPSHIYAAAGTYTACLIATNACGSDTTCNSVTVSPPCNISSLSISNEQCNGLDFTFDVSFSVSNGSGTYEVFDGSTVLAKGNSSPITVTISNSTTASGLSFNVRDSANTSCTAGFGISLTTLDCDACQISATTAFQACNTDGTVNLDVTVDYANPASDQFAIYVDSIPYGPYDYSANPSGSTITIPNLIADGSMISVVVVDTSEIDEGGLYVSSILANQGTTTDLNGDNTVNFCDEFVSIGNWGPAPLDISGYSIWDQQASNTLRHTFPSGTVLLTNESLRLFNSDLSTAPSCGSGVWNNGGDGVEIRDASNTIIFTQTYTSSSAGIPALFFPPGGGLFGGPAFCAFNTNVQLPSCAIPLTVEARASCSGAGINEFYVLVDTVFGGSGGYNVVGQGFSGGYTMPYNGSPILLGPYAHSGNGNLVVMLIATDSSGNSDTLEVVEALCGYPQNQAFCDCDLGSTAMPGAILSQAAPGSFIAGGTSGQTQVYALVDTLDGLIDSVNGTGLFTGLANGGYDVYAINYKDDITAGLVKDSSIQDIIDGTTGTGLYAGLCYSVCPKASYSVDCIILDETVAVADAIGCDDGNLPAVFTITAAQAGVMYELLDANGDTLSPRVMVSNTDTVAADLDLILPIPTPIDTTSYIVQASVPGTGCMLMLTTQPQFIPTPTPLLQFQGGINICKGDAYNLNSASIRDFSLAATLFSYYDTDPATGTATPIGVTRGFNGRPGRGNVIVSPMVDTDYWVVASTPVGCTDTIVLHVRVQEVPGLDPRSLLSPYVRVTP